MMLLLPEFKRSFCVDAEVLSRAAESWLCIEVEQKVTDMLSRFGEQEGAGGW